jgi:hypothetical protein
LFVKKLIGQEITSLFSFSILKFCLLHSLSHASRIPIARSFCRANLNGTVYDLTGFTKRSQPFTFHAPDDNQNYFIRVCQELTLSDIGNQSPVDLLEASAVRCDASDPSRCSLLSATTTFDWKYIDPTSPPLGVIYFSEGEPFVDRYTNFPETFDLEFIVYCEPDITAANVPAQFSFDSAGTTQSLRVTLHHNSGCPVTTAAPPTPTATPWNPNCHFVRRDPQSPRYGVDVELDEFNSGPYGSRLPIWIDNRESLLYLQLCERADCPLGYSCPHDSLSSAWLCDHRATNKTCTSIGTASLSYTDFLSSASSAEGIRVSLIHDFASQTRLKAEIRCDWTVPAGHVHWNTTARLENSALTLAGISDDVCRKSIPVPNPGGSCAFADLTAAGERVVLSLGAYDRVWERAVRNSVGEEFTLRYRPCGEIYCPVGAFCDGDEDAKGTGSWSGQLQSNSSIRRRRRPGFWFPMREARIGSRR